ncbi:p360 2L [African swine fever virus]|uniref:p360 2L n=1 Tax=African swine fever virus TaxID=10497 RepID=A0A894KU20_ASF|nr:p360 2L [African swine fever virus]
MHNKCRPPYYFWAQLFIPHYIFTSILCYQGIIFFWICRFYCYKRDVCIIQIFICYYFYYYIIFLLFCYFYALFESITSYIYTKEHVITIQVFYRSIHCPIVVSPYCKTIQNGYKIAISHTGYIHHFINIHINLFYMLYFMQIRHVITRKPTYYPPIFTMSISLLQILDGFSYVIYYRHTIPISTYHFVVCNIIQYTVVRYLLYKTTNYYFQSLYILEKGLITYQFMAYNIITTTFITMYFIQYLYNIRFIQNFCTYLPAEIPSMLRIVSVYATVYVCTPFGIQLYYIILVFLHSFHYCEIYIYTIFTNCCFYHQLFILITTKHVWSSMPPQTTIFQNTVLFFTYVLCGQHFFIKSLQRRWST